MNGGLISSKDISTSSFEKEPNRFDDGGGYLYSWVEYEGWKRKSGTRRRLIPTIHLSTYRKGMSTDRQLLSTRYPSKTYPLLLYVSVSPPFFFSNPQRITNGGKQEPFSGGSSRFSIQYWEKNTVFICTFSCMITRDTLRYYFFKLLF